MKTLHTRTQDVFKVMAGIPQLRYKKDLYPVKSKCKQLRLHIGEFFNTDTCSHNGRISTK